jgi:hypothetical protein
LKKVIELFALNLLLLRFKILGFLIFFGQLCSFGQSINKITSSINDLHNLNYTLFIDSTSSLTINQIEKFESKFQAKPKETGKHLLAQIFN